ncbi:MAG TPA: SusD/RagB family nutrient-binding outer membrane lipoprotein [Mucilaginibacter sp.]
MKRNILKTIVIVSLTFFTFGCKKITDINTSPNNPPLASATPQILFPSAVASTAARIGGELDILGGMWGEYYTQYTLANQFRTIDAYNLTRNDLNANWNELYAGALEDYQLAITQAKAKGLNNFVLMSTCMKAYTLEVLADLYDQVPYSQALLGQANVQPQYDAGHSVYLGLIAEIDAALKANYAVDLGEPDASTDFVFNGNMAEWAEFANTLELKMYLRMINAFPAEASAGVQKVFGNGIGFLTNDAGMNIFTNTPNKDNPFYEYNIRSLNTTTNIKASITFVSYLESTNDPRIVAYFGKTAPTGINQGDYNGSNATYGSADNPVQNATDPVWFISAAESYFLQAEAVARYGVSGSASALYQSGVESSFVDNGLTAGAADTYLLQPSVAYPTAGPLAAQIQAIITQKWVSVANGCHTLEGFFDQERTGYPVISSVYSNSPSYVPGQWVYSLNGVTTGKLFPKRLIFPESEYTTNKNTPTEVPLTTPVWWALPTSLDQ